MDYGIIAVLVAGLTMAIPTLVLGITQGKICGKTIEAISSGTKADSKGLKNTMLIAMSLVESLAIYALIVVLSLLFVGIV